MSGRERMAEPADINVDELRRRARRRLVGAVVLALGVAVVVPMLLETEQRPLGEDVSVRIPPIDDSKFVNKLSENRDRDAAKTVEKGSGKDTMTVRPSESSSAAERTSKYDTRVADSLASGAPRTGASKAAADSASSHPTVPASSSTNPATGSPSKPSSSTSPEASSVAVVPGASSPAAAPPGASSPAAAPPGASSPAAGPGASSPAVTPGASSPAAAPGASSPPVQTSSAAPPGKTEAAKTDTKPVIIEDRAKSPVTEKSSRSETKLATAPSSSSPPPASAVAADAKSAGHDGYAVQLAAFADDKGANALAGRLKRSGYAAYTEPLKTSKGTLWRVRVGPYASREAALAARERLKSEGQSGIVAALR